MIRNSNTTYGWVSRALHWSMALLILGMIVVGYVMCDIATPSLKHTLHDLHKATGTLLLFLVLLRLVWRSMNVQPSLPALPLWQNQLAKLTLVLLYVLMICVSLSGFTGALAGGHAISFYGLFTIPAFTEKLPALSSLCWQLHGVLPYVLLGVIGLHLCGALYHQLILKDNLLKRMW